MFAYSTRHTFLTFLCDISKFFCNANFTMLLICSKVFYFSTCCSYHFATALTPSCRPWICRRCRASTGWRFAALADWCVVAAAILLFVGVFLLWYVLSHDPCRFVVSLLERSIDMLMRSAQSSFSAGDKTVWCL